MASKLPWITLRTTHSPGSASSEFPSSLELIWGGTKSGHNMDPDQKCHAIGLLFILTTWTCKVGLVSQQLIYRYTNKYYILGAFFYWTYEKTFPTTSKVLIPSLHDSLAPPDSWVLILSLHDWLTPPDSWVLVMTEESGSEVCLRDEAGHLTTGQYSLSSDVVIVTGWRKGTKIVKPWISWQKLWDKAIYKSCFVKEYLDCLSGQPLQYLYPHFPPQRL